MKRILLSLLLAVTVFAADARSYFLDDVGQVVPLIAAPAIGVAGVDARHTFRERLAVTVTAVAIDEILVQTMKHTIRSRRPDGTDNHSFPSGHMALCHCRCRNHQKRVWLGLGSGCLSLGGRSWRSADPPSSSSFRRCGRRGCDRICVGQTGLSPTAFGAASVWLG